MSITHSFVSAVVDGGDTSLVRPSNWNAAHVVTDYIDYPLITTPAAPPAGDLRVFGRSRAGRALLAAMGPSGVDVSIQPAFFGNSITMWAPSNTTAQTAFGAAYTARNSGTSAAQSTPAISATNAMSSMRRALFGTGTTTTGASGTQTAQLVAWRGNAAGLGGFFFASRLGIETLASDQRVIVGLSANNAVIAADPSTLNNTIALIKDTGDSSWFVSTRNTAGTKTTTGATVTAGQILDFFIFCPPNGSQITVRLVDAVTGTIYMDDVAITATLPASTTFMYMQAHTQSVTGTTAKTLALNRLYLETDL